MNTDIMRGFEIIRNLTKEEMLKEMEEIKDRRSHLTMADFKLSRKLFVEYLTLKKKVKKLEKNT